MAAFCVSGLPCPDMSTAGKRRKRAGPTNAVNLAHGKYITQLPKHHYCWLSAHRAFQNAGRYFICGTLMSVSHKS